MSHDVLRRTLQLAAVAATLWSLGISLFIAFAPRIRVGYEATESGVLNEADAIYHVETYQERGTGDFIALAIPCLMAVGACVALYRGRPGVALASSVVLLLFSFLTGFSIGSRFIPAALLLVVVSLVACVAASRREVVIVDHGP